MFFWTCLNLFWIMSTSGFCMLSIFFWSIWLATLSSTNWAVAIGQKICTCVVVAYCVLLQEHLHIFALWKLSRKRTQHNIFLRILQKYIINYLIESCTELVCLLLNSCNQILVQFSLPSLITMISSSMTWMIYFAALT